MGFSDDDFDEEDDLTAMLIMDEMDADDMRMNRGGGCLAIVLMFVIIPVTIILMTLKS